MSIDTNEPGSLPQEVQDRAQIDAILSKPRVREVLEEVEAEFDALPGRRLLSGIRPDGMVVIAQTWSVPVDEDTRSTIGNIAERIGAAMDGEKVRATVLGTNLPVDQIKASRLTVDFTFRDMENMRDGSHTFPESGVFTANEFVRRAGSLRTAEAIQAMDITPGTDPVAILLKRTGGFRTPGYGDGLKFPYVGGKPLYPLPTVTKA